MFRLHLCQCAIDGGCCQTAPTLSNHSCHTLQCLHPTNSPNSKGLKFFKIRNVEGYRVLPVGHCGAGLIWRPCVGCWAHGVCNSQAAALFLPRRKVPPSSIGDTQTGIRSLKDTETVTFYIRESPSGAQFKTWGNSHPSSHGIPLARPLTLSQNAR